MVISSYQGKRFDNIEVLAGKSMGPSGKADKTVLVGNYMMKTNRRDSRIKETILAKGFPTTFEEIIGAFERCDVGADMEEYQRL
jgi:hypothetical protein